MGRRSGKRAWKMIPRSSSTPANAPGGPASRILPAVFWFALTIALFVAAFPYPIAVPGEPSDKVQHVVAFVVLSALGAVAYPRVSAVKLLVGMGAFGALIEIVQLIPALNRNSEMLDWIADAAAATVTLALVVAVRALRTAHASVGRAGREE